MWVCKETQVFLVPLVLEATLVLMVIADQSVILVLTVPLVLEATLVLMVCTAHEALLVHQVQEDSKVHQECLWST